MVWLLIYIFKKSSVFVQYSNSNLSINYIDNWWRSLWGKSNTTPVCVWQKDNVLGLLLTIENSDWWLGLIATTCPEPLNATSDFITWTRGRHYQWFIVMCSIYLTALWSSTISGYSLRSVAFQCSMEETIPMMNAGPPKQHVLCKIIWETLKRDCQ